MDKGGERDGWRGRKGWMEKIERWMEEEEGMDEGGGRDGWKRERDGWRRRKGWMEKRERDGWRREIDGGGGRDGWRRERDGWRRRERWIKRLMNCESYLMVVAVIAFGRLIGMMEGGMKEE